jgi:DNA repair protein SbcC/Rad50
VTVPKLRTLTITDFRGIRGAAPIALNAPVVLLHGTNGAGKSTVTSALELALTGNFSGFEKTDPRHLVHRGAKKATIQLLMDDGATIDFEIDRSGVAGKPLLEVEEGNYFAERCYLQQRTLGNLLELYEEPAENGPSALTEFVNDLLGLDELEDLIDGLHVIGHKRRVAKLIPAYENLEREQKNLQAEIGLLKQAAQQETDEEATARGELRSLLTSLNAPSKLAEEMDAAAAWLEREEGGADKALIILTAARRELNALSARAESLEQRKEADDLRALEVAAAAARKAADAWRKSEGQSLEALLDGARNSLPGVPASGGVTDPASVLEHAQQLAETEIAQLEELLEDATAADAEVERLQGAIGEAQHRLTGIDAQLSELRTATTAEELGKALAMLVPHTHTEDCPICGRDYSEVSREPLSAHLAARVSELASEAERLQKLANARVEAASDLRRLQERREAVSREHPEPSVREKAAALLEELKALRRQLVEIAPGVSKGAAILRAEAEGEQALLRTREKDTSLLQLRTEIDEVASSLKQPPTQTAASATDRLASLSAYVEDRIAFFERRSTLWTEATEKVESITVAADESTRTERELVTAEGELKRSEAAIAELEERRTSLKELRKDAISARSRIVRSVFTKSLNNVWRDLFLRLAPEEPFVPGFRIPKENERVIASLVTMHRDGSPGGSPGEMLSAGNLNTAALTLFLALNLSVPRRLPWIVLDDPVQSMDEVHVAQFAALLRTLTKEHGRQVILAVHERALFDYLSLELSPAGPKEGLAAIELTRARDGSTSTEPQFHTYEEDRAFVSA